MSPVEEKTVRISVRELVEFIFKEGDIDNRISGEMDREAMLQGGRIHRKIQRRMGSDYHADYKKGVKNPRRLGESGITFEYFQQNRLLNCL